VDEATGRVFVVDSYHPPARSMVSMLDARTGDLLRSSETGRGEWNTTV
jgi:hypothetical protein